MRPADDTFQSAMRTLDECVMQRRSANSFRGDHRVELQLRADEYSRHAMNLAMAGVDAPAADR